MSVEHIQAGIRLADRLDIDNQRQLAELRSDSIKKRGLALNSLIAKYALFGYAVRTNEILAGDFPGIEELPGFPKLENNLAAASVALGEAYDAQPDVFIPLIVTRPPLSKESDYTTSLVVADSRPSGLLYHDYFRREGRPENTVMIDGKEFNTAKSMDGHTYQELSRCVRRSEGKTDTPGFDQDSYTVLTAYPPDKIGGIFAMSPQGRTIQGISGGLRCKFRPSVTLA